MSYTEQRTQWIEAARRINEVNDANGWDRPTMESLPIKIMLVVTELDEAVHAVQNPHADPLNEELADVVVRLLHILESLWPGDWALRERNSYYGRELVFQSIQTTLWDVLTPLCSAVEHWRSDKAVDVRISLEYAFEKTRAIARRLGFDLLQDVQEKTERNAERGLRHGRARSAG